MNEILRHRPKDFSRSRRISSIIDELGPRGVFTSEGEQWRGSASW